ncbi:hypothetical protein Dsin_025099 [Dipteronia sinensis]|uniref:Uncharacterized protein n=1 Tax=Dipteronia sinensis TaxID=43782 RepID=A0AAE0DY12_9ROSI|nr:hypothetical protein Dsin_025099 [Dipteronia sinensis]
MGRWLPEDPHDQEAVEETFCFMIERPVICYIIFYLFHVSESEPLEHFLIRFGFLFVFMLLSLFEETTVSECGLIQMFEKVAYIVLCFGFKYKSCLYFGVAFFFITHIFFFDSFYLKHLHRIEYFRKSRQKLPVRADYRSKSMAIEQIRATETALFKIERFVIFFLLFLTCHFPHYLNFAVLILILTNVLYYVLILQRQEKRPYTREPDDVFFRERLAFIFTIFYQESRYTIFWYMAAGIFVFTNVILINQFFNHKIKETSETNENNHHHHEKELKEAREKSDRAGEEPKMMIKDDQKEKETKSNQEVENSLKDEKVLSAKLEAASSTTASTSSSSFSKETDINDEPKKDEVLYEAKDNLDGRLQETIEIDEKNHENALKEAEDHQELNRAGEKLKKIMVKDDHEKKSNWSNELEGLLEKLINEILSNFSGLREQLVINLKEEKNNLISKLDIANETVEYYQSIVRDFAEQSLMWDEEKKVLLTKLEVTSQKHQRSMKKLEEKGRKLKQEKNELSSKLSEVISWYEYYANMANRLAIELDHELNESMEDFEECRREWEEKRRNSWYDYYAKVTYDYKLYNHNLLVEKNDLSDKLRAANSSTEFYKASLDDSEKTCRKLKEEISELSVKLFAETLSSERSHMLLNELEEKYKRLEEEKNDLSAKLNAAKASSELYRSFLHDYEIVPRCTS